VDWQDKVAIVTGASSGIGLATARSFVQRGTRVALVARSQDKLTALAHELGAERARGFVLDVTDRRRIVDLPAQVVAHFGRLDIVVNNAGVNHRGVVAELAAAELAAIVDTNLVAPVLLTRAALPQLSPGGVIVNVASLAGKIPVPHEAAYSASKAGLRAFSRALAAELAVDGNLRVCTICPGPVDTGFFGEDLARVPNLVFSQPMSSAEQIADEVVRAVEQDVAEIDVPPLSGKLATLGYLWPRLMGKLRPLLERQGARNKQRYLRRQRAQ
jgi:short-subunit dehydrogenase